MDFPGDLVQVDHNIIMQLYVGCFYATGHDFSHLSTDWDVFKIGLFNFRFPRGSFRVENNLVFDKHDKLASEPLEDVILWLTVTLTCTHLKANREELHLVWLIISPDSQVFLVWALELLFDESDFLTVLWAQRECSVTFAAQTEFFIRAGMQFKTIWKFGPKFVITDLFIFTPAPVLVDKLAVPGFLNACLGAIVWCESCSDIEALGGVKFVQRGDFVVKQDAKDVNVSTSMDRVDFNQHV